MSSVRLPSSELRPPEQQLQGPQMGAAPHLPPFSAASWGRMITLTPASLDPLGSAGWPMPSLGTMAEGSWMPWRPV